MTDSRSTFGPVVLAGLSGSGLAAVAGNQPWAEVRTTNDADRALVDVALTGGSAEFPVAGALALVCLAAWGVLLVTRGGVRRLVAVVATAAALGVLLATVLGFALVPETVRDAVAELGVASPDVSRTWWWWLALLAGTVALAAGSAAVRWAPGWPEMGRKYDAPATRRSTRRPARDGDRTSAGDGEQESAGRHAGQHAGDRQEETDSDLWRALDEGHDPTA